MTMALPCPGDLLHDAYVIEDANGCAMSEALDGAAQGHGFANHADAAEAILSAWRAAIIGAEPSTERGREAVRDAVAMLGPVGLDLVRGGWGARDLFGLHRGGSRHGLAFLLRGGGVAWATANAINYRAGASGQVVEFNRASVDPGAVVFWELAK